MSTTQKPYIVEIAAPAAPDGGYGWFVVCAAFLSHVITHGIMYSFGVLFITIEERFGGTKADVSWILSIATGMLYLIGPVAGYLAGRYGIKMTTLLGTIIGSLGFILSMFVTNLYLLYITIGFISGCGLGMVFLGAIVIVTVYFDTRRSLASGIALSGAGSGAFIFSPLMKMLTNMFSWKGTCLILAGIILNCIPCGLLFKPVTNFRIKQTTSTVKTDDTECVLEEASILLNDYEKDVYERTDDRIQVECKINSYLPSENRFKANSDISDACKARYEIAGETVCETESEIVNEMDGKSINATLNREHESIGMIEEPIPLTMESEDLLESNKGELGSAQNNDADFKNDINDSEQCDTYSNEQQEHATVTKEDCLTRDDYLNPSECTEHFVSNDARKRCSVNEEHESRTRSQFMNQLDLFRSRVFVLFVFSQFMFFIGFYLPFFYIPDKAKQTGISEGVAVWAVSAIGISSIVGRIILGYVADRPTVNRMLIFEVALLVSGLSTALGPLLVTPWSLFVYAPIYGSSTGIILSLTPVVLADLLGVSRLANAFGINNFFCGAASLIGPPFAGLLYDVTGNYDTSFIVAGLSMTTAGLLMFVARCVKPTTS